MGVAGIENLANLGAIGQQLQNQPYNQWIDAHTQALQQQAQYQLAQYQNMQNQIFQQNAMAALNPYHMMGLGQIGQLQQQFAYQGGLFLPTTIDPETAEKAKARAKGLLKTLLRPEQWDEFQKIGAVTETIDGCRYRLTPGGMIEAEKPRLVGSVKERWCVYPNPWADGNDYMPEEDKLIGQLLHLRAGPEKVRQSANVFPS